VKRRGKANDQPSKNLRRNRAALKARGARNPDTSPAELREQLDQRTRERDEALEQQAATSKVLQVISSSSGDLEPIFATMLAEAVRICGANFGNIYRWDGHALHLTATHNTPAAFAELRRRLPIRVTSIRGTLTPTGHMVATKKTVHVADLAAEPIYTQHQEPGAVAAVELGGVRTLLSVPILKDNELIGAFTLCRQKEVRRFTDRQIALVTDFAAQAVIAIENARLLSELRRRTDELDHSVAELKRERNNKLMNLEAMVASIGHEVRQPLGSIAANGAAALRFLNRLPPDLDEARLCLNGIERDSLRAAEIFSNIRALFGKGDERPEAINLNDMTRDVLQTLDRELNNHRITTHAELASKLPIVMGHKGQLQEVFVNLIQNAIEAMDAIKDDDRILRVRTEHNRDNTIVASVEDSGPGIEPSRLGNIFDAFVTTKSHGMGLGLAICRMIVERHKGRLVVSPGIQCGSIFRVVLPIETANGQTHSA
jgi:signal transduction histidine kinase